MDILVDSDLSDQSNIEINKSGPIIHYLYEPFKQFASGDPWSAGEIESLFDVDIGVEIPTFKCKIFIFWCILCSNIISEGFILKLLDCMWKVIRPRVCNAVF